MVVPFDEELLNPASLDLRLGDYLMVESIYSPELVRINIADKTEDDPFMLQSGEFCLAETLELFNLARRHQLPICTQVKPCTRWS